MDEHDAAVTVDGRVVGGALFILADLVVTAAHCLKDRRPDEPIGVQVKDGHFEATVLATASEKDLCLLTVHLPPTDIVSRAKLPALPYVNAEWRSPHRHPKSQIAINGTVTDLVPGFRCESGGTIRAVQLSVMQERIQYGGYSGAPVELAKKTRNPFGLLIEQRRAAEGELPSNVLFAADMREVLDAFELADLNVIDTVRDDAIEAAITQLRDITAPLVDEGYAAEDLPSRLEMLLRAESTQRRAEVSE